MDTQLSDMIKTRDIIRKKFNAFRHGEAETSMQLEKQFKPVSDPLKAILKAQTGNQGKSKEPPDEVKEDVEEEENGDAEVVVKGLEAESTDPSTRNELYEVLEKNYGPQVSAYLYDKLTSTAFAGKAYDETYGVRRDKNTNGWMIGNRSVTFDPEGKLKVGGVEFDPKPGFLELIFKKYPRGYTDEDLERYHDVLEITSAHKRFHDKDKPINSNRSTKYKDVIAKLYPASRKSIKRQSSQGKSVIKGSGFSKPPQLPQQVFVPLDKKSERVFVYWDDPNELVERLGLLIASRDAGHTGHEREILSITEELREAGYIE